MESIGNVMQVTSEAAQQANEANKKQLEKQQPTEKSLAVFLGALDTQGDNNALMTDRATPLFALLIARLNGSGDNASNANDRNHSPRTEGTTDTANTLTTTTTPVATTERTDSNAMATSASDSSSANTNNTSDSSAIFNTTSVPNLGAPSVMHNTPIFTVTVPNLGGNGNNASQTAVPASSNTGDGAASTVSTTPRSDVAGTDSIPTATNNTVNSNVGANTSSNPPSAPSTDSSNVRNVPIFGNVTVPSLGSVGGASSQGQGGTNSTAVGSPLVRSSPVATQVGEGFQSLLAGNTSTGNNTSNSSHWRRGSSSSSLGGLDISSFFRR